VVSFQAEYPTSSKKATNWDKIVNEIENEEKNEQLEGDAALNKYIFYV
jgi:suppressor of G2 allele of SKP1